MADSTAGKASNLTMGQSKGATKDPLPSRTSGLNKGLAGPRGEGGEIIRDFPLLSRDAP